MKPILSVIATGLFLGFLLSCFFSFIGNISLVDMYSTPLPYFIFLMVLFVGSRIVE